MQLPITKLDEREVRLLNNKERKYEYGGLTDYDREYLQIFRDIADLPEARADALTHKVSQYSRPGTVQISRSNRDCDDEITITRLSDDEWLYRHYFKYTPE